MNLHIPLSTSIVLPRTEKVAKTEVKYMSKTENKSEIEAFLEQAKAEAPETGSSTTVYPNRDRLQADFDTLYQGYIIEGYNEGIEGNYGVSTAVNVIDTNNEGRRMTLWVGGFETNHFAQFIEGQAANGNALPLQVSFVRTKQTSEKTGRTFNKLTLRLDAAGDDVVIPAMPEDQVAEA